MSKNLTERKIAELKELLKHRAEARELLKGKKVEFKWADEDKTIREYLLLFDGDGDGDELTGLIKFIFTRGGSLQVENRDGVQIFDSETNKNPASWLQEAISKTSEVLKESDRDKAILNLIRQCFLRDRAASPSLPNVPDGFQLRIVDNKSAEHVFLFEQGQFFHISARDGITSGKTVVDEKLMEELKEQINKNNFELDVPVTDLGNVHLIKYKFIDGILCSSLVSKRGVSNLPTTVIRERIRHNTVIGGGSGLVIESSATEFLPTSEYYAKMLEKALTASLGDEAKSGASADSAREHLESPSDMTKTPKQIPKNLKEKLETLAVATAKSGEVISITSKDFTSASGGRIAQISSDAGAEAVRYVEDAGSKLKIKARPMLTRKIKGEATNLELAGVELDGAQCAYFDGATDLFMANFRGCVFSKVDFSKVVNLDTVLFTNCKFGDGCIFPEKFVFKQSNLKGTITMESLRPYIERGDVSISTPAAVIKNPSGVALSMERIRTGSVETSSGA